MSKAESPTVPMSAPDVSEEDVEAVIQVLRSGQVSQGEANQAFERAFAERLKVPCCVSVSSGTAGLHLALQVSGVGRGDVVVTSPFSFVATANAVLYREAIPLFVDVDPSTGNLDLDQVEQVLQELQGGSPREGILPRVFTQDRLLRSRALLPVHVYGLPLDLHRLRDLAVSAGVVLIEDACEALGADSERIPAGAGGDAAVFGFFANKQITTGEGGMVATRHAEWAKKMRSLRNQGRDAADDSPAHRRLGYNYRMSGLSAALGLSQLRRLDSLLRRRGQVAGWYRERLVDCPGIDLSLSEPVDGRSWFCFVIRLRDPQRRDALRRDLAQRGVPTRIYFEPIHLQPHFRRLFGYRPGDFPQAERLSSECLALPFSSVMTEEQVEFVCGVLLERLYGLD